MSKMLPLSPVEKRKALLFMQAVSVAADLVSTRKSPAVYNDYWENSTSQKGIRQMRVRLFGSMHHWVVSPTENHKAVSDFKARVQELVIKHNIGYSQFKIYKYRGCWAVQVLYYSNRTVTAKWHLKKLWSTDEYKAHFIAEHILFENTVNGNIITESQAEDDYYRWLSAKEG